MRSVRYYAADDVAYFGKFVHKVHPVVEAAGGIYEHYIGIFGNSALDCVEGHGGGVCAHCLLHYICPGPLCPYAKLVHGCGTEGIGRTYHNLLALLPEH